MEELIRQLLSVRRGMWQYRWTGVAVAWLVGILSVAIAFWIPDRYEASARIYVDTQSILKPLMSGLAVQPNVDQQVVMLSRTLISRPNVEKLIRMADLDLKAESRTQQEGAIEELTKKLEIRSTDRDNLYTLSYRDSDSARAKRVVQSLVSIFVESGLGASRKDTDAARVFINEQIKSYQAKLEEAEARLKDFRLRNIDLQTADGRDSAGRISDLGAQLDSAKLELREAEQAREAAKASLENERNHTQAEALPNLLNESSLAIATPEIDARLEAQKKNLDALLQRFTDQHPEVLSTRRVIAELEAQKSKELKELRQAAMAASSAAPSVNNSLAYQELNRLLASSEVQVASLRARVAEYSSRLNQARAQIKTIPQVEAEAAQLNRDYAIHKKNYEDLVSRREAAKMSGDLEVASGMADFRLIDPPRVSPKPVWPNRLLSLALAMLAAIGAGLFASFAAAELRPVFYEGSELRTKFQLPLLGVVSLVLTDAERQREKGDLVRFWTASGSLVGLFAFGLTAVSVLAGR
jgi:polysaccharide chain length determinant protein (PEP-CTERM system associated)